MGMCDKCEIFKEHSFTCKVSKLTNAKGTNPIGDCKPKTWDDYIKEQDDWDD